MINPVIHIAIADDHQIFRRGLMASLQPFEDLEIMTDVSCGEDLLVWLKAIKQKPEVILVDMKMTGMDGVETTNMIKQKYPAIKVIGLSVYENHFHVVNMFKAGASAYLLKDSSPDEIVDAIRTVMDQDYYFNHNISLRLLKSIVDKDTFRENRSVTGEELNEQEAELLKLICSEYTNAEIATMLNLGPKTIENYRNRLLAKTGAKNTAGLVMYAIRKGYFIV